MDKYGVVTNDELIKIAGRSGTPCPECGSGRVNHTGVTPHCPNCGTRPWERRSNASEKEGRKGR